MRILKLKTTLWDDDGYLTDVAVITNGKCIYPVFAKKNQIFYCRELDDTVRDIYDIYRNGEGDEIVMYSATSTLEWLFYINYHMHLFNVQTEKSEKKWRAIFGDEKFNNLRLCNECDKAR